MKLYVTWKESTLWVGKIFLLCLLLTKKKGLIFIKFTSMPKKINK